VNSGPRSTPAIAPGKLALLQNFLNTLHVERGTDMLAAAGTAYAWVEGAVALPSAEPGAADLDRLRRLRRELRARCGDGPRDDAELTRLAAAAPVQVVPGGTGALELIPLGDGHPAVLATLLAIAHDAERDGSWARLKICHHDGCRWAFYDRSRSRTATWCAMGICGNRTKVAAYRRRSAAS
jgi:predicted RNA-binding Zn ribbon-like protein